MVTSIYSLASTSNKPFNSWSKIPLYYGEEWKEAQTSDKNTTLKDCYNKLNFTPVKTTGLKIVAKLQKGVSGEVLE